MNAERIFQHLIAKSWLGEVVIFLHESDGVQENKRKKKEKGM